MDSAISTCQREAAGSREHELQGKTGQDGGYGEEPTIKGRGDAKGRQTLAVSQEVD